ncbi:hypothetical protein ACSBR2_015219 [Camellia fascicularis]
MTFGAAIAAAGSAAAKESWNCFKPHFDYVKDLDKNYEELKSIVLCLIVIVSCIRGGGKDVVILHN